MYGEIFESALEWITKYKFDKFTSQWLEEFCWTVAIYAIYDIPYPQSLIDLREWLYKRVRKDFQFRNTGYLNEHAVIGIMWSAMLILDKARNDGVWNEYRY